jgi:peptidoglycan hydrolase-like protein with peptidoglycan-binding domain
MKTALVALVLFWAGATHVAEAATVKKTASRGHAHTRQARGRARKVAAKAPPRPYVQNEPSPDRYREIQGALASKGYLKSTPSGAWDAETQDAMRRYQTDNQFEATGRINSRSLLGLGLGGGTQDPH